MRPVSEAADTPRLSARVSTADGRRFLTPASYLTRASVFLETTEPMRVHDELRLSLGELELDAEVGLVSRDPAGVVAAFSVPVAAEAALLRLLGPRPSPSKAEEPWSESTVPGEAGDIEMAMAAARAAGADTASNAAQSPFATGEFRALTPNPFASLTPTPFSDVVPPGSTIESADVPSSRATEPPAPAASRTGTETGGEGSLPELTADGTLRFASATAFQTQFSANLVHGGVVARSGPLPIGSHKMLRFEVPGATESVQVSARVGFVGQGTVGFMIDTFALQRPRLESLLQQLA